MRRSITSSSSPIDHWVALEDPKATIAFLREHGVFRSDEDIILEVLTGGVSSLVIKARAGSRSVIVKQALPQLRVRDEWIARVERSAVEARCTAFLNRLVPGQVPVLLAVDRYLRAFVMTCAPEGSETWKALLMRGVVNLDCAAEVGRLLGRIHTRSAGNATTAQSFDDRSFFDELRLDPYLRTIARRHPDLADELMGLVEEQLATRLCLVHGDFSPKNLLITPPGNLLLLDHEVAHWGNPAFDAAFVLTHLCLKALKFTGAATQYTAAARTLWSAYLSERPPGGAPMEATVARLLGGLMLARIDGKSPVEYLVTGEERDRVRSLACQFLRERLGDVLELLARVEAASIGAPR